MDSGKDRRQFVKKATAGLITLPLIGAKDLTAISNSRLEDLDLYLEDGLVYLNTGSLGPSPKWVVNRIHELTKILESNPVSENWGPLGKEMEAVREKAATFFKCSKEEIVLTRNTTEGLSMVSSTLELMEGDEILTTNHEHGGGEVGLDYKSTASSVQVKKLELPFPAQNADQIIETVISQVSESSRLLMLSHVSTITGMIMPLKEISDEIRGNNIFLLGDGAQACGMVNVDVLDLGVDAYATSGHKWLMGPKETGILYIRKDSQENVKPVFTHSGYGSYSASSGTRNVAQFIALGEILQWHMDRGHEKIEKDIRGLADYCYSRLTELEGLQIISPKDPNLRSAMISAIVLNKSNRDVYDYLKSKDIVVKVLPKYNALRFSTHVFNTTNDIDKLADELKTFL